MRMQCEVPVGLALEDPLRRPSLSEAYGRETTATKQPSTTTMGIEQIRTLWTRDTAATKQANLYDDYDGHEKKGRK